MPTNESQLAAADIELQKIEAEKLNIQATKLELTAAKKALAAGKALEDFQASVVEKIWAFEDKEGASKPVSNLILETLKTGDQIFKAKMFKQYKVTFREFIYELEMAWRAVTTRQPVKGLISQFYDPILYDYAKVYSNKLKEALFENDDYFGFKDKMGNLDSMGLLYQKEQIKYHINKSQIKPVWKAAFDNAVKLGTAVTKVLPCMEREIYQVKTQDQFGLVITDTVNAQKKVLDMYNVDITNLYITNPYEKDLNKQNFSELKETTFQELKRLEKLGVYKNIDKIKEPVSAKDYDIDENFYDDMRELMQVDKDKIRDINKKKKEVDFKVRLAEFWGSIMLDDGNKYKVRLTMAGVQLIGVNLQIQIIGTEEVPYDILRIEEFDKEFYGWGKMHRLLKTQLLHNLLWNLTTDLNIKNLQGNMIVSQDNKILIQQQLDGGLKPNETIGINVPSGMRTDQLVMPIKYPDPNNIQQINEQLLTQKFERGTLSRAQQGMPTGSQLDRTGKGYALAVGQGDSNIKEDIYSIQDNYMPACIRKIFFIVARNAYDKVFVGYAQSVDSQGNAQAPQPVFQSGKDLYGIPNIQIYGGSLYLENEKKMQDIKDLIGMIANSKAAERINWDAILQKYAVLRGFDINEFVNNKQPQEMLQEIFAAGITPEQLEELLKQIVADRRNQMIKEQEGQDISNKQGMLNKIRVNQALKQAQMDQAEQEADDFDADAFLTETGLSVMDENSQLNTDETLVDVDQDQLDNEEN